MTSLGKIRINMLKNHWIWYQMGHILAKFHRPTHQQLWTWPLTKQWQQGRADLSAFRATLGFWGLQRSLAYVHGGFPKMGIPQMELFIMKHPIKMGWFGGTPILGTPLWSFCYWQPTQKNAEHIVAKEFHCHHLAIPTPPKPRKRAPKRTGCWYHCYHLGW